METNKTMTVEQAIRDIVAYETLPPQIDYTKPWEIKSATAIAFLESLPVSECDKAMKEIETKVTNYYDSGASTLDAMF